MNAYSVSVHNGIRTQSLVWIWDEYLSNPELDINGTNYDFDFTTPPEIQAKMNIDPESYFAIRESVISAMQLKLADLFTGNTETGAGIVVFSSDAMQAVWDTSNPPS